MAILLTNHAILFISYTIGIHAQNCGMMCMACLNHGSAHKSHYKKYDTGCVIMMKVSQILLYRYLF